MKRGNLKKAVTVLLSVILVSSLFTGCSKKGEAVKADAADTSAAVVTDAAATPAADASEAVPTETVATQEVKTIIVGTGSAYKPVCYLDDNGDLAGYEIEVFKAIDELLPQYEIEFEIFDFKNIVLALDGGKIDIGAHQYEWNEEREKNYLFAKEYYTTFYNYLWVKDGVTDITSLDDLGGKTIQAGAGSNVAYLLETYNTEHPDNQIVIDYSASATTEEWIANLASGKYAATIGIERDMEYYNEAYSDLIHLVKVGEPITNSNTYYLYKKGNTELQEAIDGALKQLKDSGKLSEISIAVWGADYTK